MLKPLVSILSILLLVACGQKAQANLLHPSDYSSAGHFTSVPGTYSLNTTLLTLTGPEGFSATGIFHNGIAIFTFDSFSLGTGASLITLGNNPAAILSNSTIDIAGGGIRVWSGGGAGGEPQQSGAGPGGGFPGYNFFGGAGGGGGFGGKGGRGQFENATFDFPGQGGPAYGDLEVLLQAGSGGGGGKTNFGFQSAGGDGGGALELGALQNIDILSLVSADGLPGQPRDSNHTGGGGGSGGGLILHAPYINNFGNISANGGRGGDGVFENGGGGGGGRIFVNTLPGGFQNPGLLTVRGGSAPADFFGAGSPGEVGVITIRSTLVPEPTSASLALLLATGGLMRRR